VLTFIELRLFSVLSDMQWWLLLADLYYRINHKNTIELWKNVYYYMGVY